MKVTANLATMEGREESLKQTIESLHPQVDIIRIWFNLIEPYEWLKNYPKVHAVKKHDVGAVGKLLFIDKPEYYLTCDDDLIYPANYVVEMVKSINRHPSFITAYHGRILGEKGKNYYLGHSTIHFQKQTFTTYIDTPGTGVCGFRTDFVRPEIPLTAKRMVDVNVGFWAAKNKVKIISPTKEAGWIKPTTVPQGDGVYVSQLNSCVVQNRIADEIIEWRLKQPKVSVIIPYRTDRGWLGEAIESVKNQDYGGEIELILAKGNHNKSKNLNDGAKLATGQFIKYLDEDDMLTPKSIRNSVDALKYGDALHGNAINLHPSGLRHTHFATVQQPTIDSMLKRNTIHGATLMYRASLFRALGGFDESINTCEEYEFNLRVLKLGIKFVFSPALLAIYRRHDKQKSLGAKANQQRREKVRQSIKNRYV